MGGLLLQGGSENPMGGLLLQGGSENPMGGLLLQGGSENPMGGLLLQGGSENQGLLGQALSLIRTKKKDKKTRVVLKIQWVACALFKKKRQENKGGWVKLSL
jgi:hypothetical protein